MTQIRQQRNTWRSFSRCSRLSLLLVAMSLASDRFLTVDNGLNVLRQISINLCLSIGMTMIILSGGIDLSVGSVLALSGAVAAGLLKNGIALPRWNVDAAIHRLRRDCRRHCCGPGGGLDQRLRHHAFSRAAVCGDARHA